MGMRYGARIATLIDLNASNDTQYLIAFGHRVVKFLQYERNAAFGAAVSVSRLIEWLALASWTEEMSSVKAKIHLVIVSRCSRTRNISLHLLRISVNLI